MSLWSLIE